jgi:selenocysteine lyase/cysteine desulfurase
MESESQNQHLGAIEASVLAALEHYANVHRGSGHSSRISTALYEHARSVVLHHLGLGRDHAVIFCTPWRLETLLRQLPSGVKTHTLSSDALGLPVAVRALAVRRRDLPDGTPALPGGGTIRMVSEARVSWADVPDRFEPGTPNILGVIAFARALELLDSAPGSLTLEPLPASDPFEDLSGLPLLEALRTQLIGGDQLVPTEAGLRPAVNFDNGASTPTFAPVWRAVRQAWRTSPAARRKIVRKARARVQRFFQAPPSEYEVIFTANTTEAIALATTALGHIAKPGTVVLNTAIEHNSNELPWRYLPGVTLARLPVDDEGFVDLDQLEQVLRAHASGKHPIAVVSVCGASNVMGSYNDLPAIARLAHRFGAKLLVDAAQLAPHRAIHMAEDGIDLLAFSAHKMYAPFGSGGLIVARGLLQLDVRPRQLAEQSGEENVVGIAALGAAIGLLDRIGMDVVTDEERKLTLHALRRLAHVPGLRIHGLRDPGQPRFARKGGVVCFELDCVPHNLLAQRLVERGGVAVRSGCFCVNMYLKRLLGVGKLKNALAHAGLMVAPNTMGKLLIGLVRISFGLTNSLADVDRLVEALKAIAAQERSPTTRWLARRHLGTPFLPRTEAAEEIERMVERTRECVFAPSRSVRSARSGEGCPTISTGNVPGTGCA